MKQLLQDLKTGSTELAEMPTPRVGPKQVLIRSSCSLVSPGTERMLVEFGKASLIQKARQHPDRVRQVLDKARTDGLVATWDAVQSKLDEPLALGYCNVGVIVEVGPAITSVRPGDRVASNGKHAEIVRVPGNLCARIPDEVSDEAAAFTVLSAIGLQGIRLANPSLGESVMVIGLGLIGLLTVQLLRSQGCRVLGVDLDPSRLALAKRFGAEVAIGNNLPEAVEAAWIFSRGRGVDAALITAATHSSDPVTLAAQACRKRGRIVLVGVAGLNLARQDFYEKELTFQVSCSYGPGRYDPTYEEGGVDYPIGFVRWTEQRNFEAVLDLMAAGKIDPRELVTHRYDFHNAVEAYKVLGGTEPSLGIVLQYVGGSDAKHATTRTVTLAPIEGAPRRAVAAAGVLGVFGAGAYAGRMLIPAFKASGATLQTLVSTGGVSAFHYGRKYGFADVSTSTDAILLNPSIDTVAIATRHDSHADLVLRALQADKHVFVEKPLCLTIDELTRIEAALDGKPSLKLMVGFNRRFSPLVQKMMELVGSVQGPKSFSMMVNAGSLPADHWTKDAEVGGGRILGEGCHFVDLLRYLAGCSIVSYEAVGIGAANNVSDSAVLTLKFEDGSVGSVQYLSGGNKGFPKERLEFFGGGKVLVLNNFVDLRGWGWQNFRKTWLWRQDKGAKQCVSHFLESVRNDTPSPINRAEIIEVSRVSIQLQNALR